jgi:hypothetical protein
MRKHSVLLAAAGIAAASLFWTTTKAADDDAGDLAKSDRLEVKLPDKREPVLRTQQFERGELQMKDVESGRLEMFLRDLNKRRDYDFSQHENRPGPDHEYLTTWIHKTMDELFARGYSLDKYGDLHRPGEVISTR